MISISHSAFACRKFGTAVWIGFVHRDTATTGRQTLVITIGFLR